MQFDVRGGHTVFQVAVQHLEVRVGLVVALEQHPARKQQQCEAE